jgi:hypothetical protein
MSDDLIHVSYNIGYLIDKKTGEHIPMPPDPNLPEGEKFVKPDNTKQHN